MTPVWHKASASGAGNCVEVAITPGAVLVRDSKDRDGRRLTVGPEAWRDLLGKIRNGSGGGAQ